MLRTLLESIVKRGTLTVVRANGVILKAGTGAPYVTIRLADRMAELKLALDGGRYAGELYMDGRLIIEQGDVSGFLKLAMMNLGSKRPGPIIRAGRALRFRLRRFAQANFPGRARRNAAHHYDLSGRLYDLFLDKDRQYSCAYFSVQGESLEEAQIGKKRHIAAKLNLDKPGLKVLDIGCGWGGLALDLARDCRADVLGITLSEEQLGVARRRALTAKLARTCKFALQDYRAVEGPFDRIVSVGMFEHVGVPFYDVYFGKIAELLIDDGVALVHTIGRSDGPGTTNAWIAKYIFPGGYAPALSEILPAAERAGLMVTDIEVLRLHYAETLKEWQRRFAANRTEIASLTDERFCRMWEFYLAASEMAFRHDGQVVFQIQLAKRVGALPTTRDYMLETERTMRFAGTERMPRPSRAA